MLLLHDAFEGLLIPTHLLVQRYAAQRDAEGSPRLVRTTSESFQKMHTWQPSASSTLAMHSAFGCVSGVISAIMGVGGLPLTMSYLTVCTPLPHHLVQGTAVLAVAPSAITSALSRVSVIPPVSAAAVTAGAMGGAAVGASAALRTPEEQLRQLYIASLVVLGGRSFVRASQNLRSIWAAHRRRS